MGPIQKWIHRKHSGSTLAGVLFYEFMRIFLCRFVLSTFYRPIIKGIEHVPERGPVLLVSNHQSYFDPPLVGSYLNRRQLDFIARGGLFKNKIFGAAIKALHSIPLAEGAPDTAAIKAAIQRLGEDGAVLIFPEGARSLDGRIHEFKRGAELILRKANCPIIPVAIEGVRDAWPRGGKPKLFGARIAITYAPPISPEELLDKNAEQRPLERIADWIDAERLKMRQELRDATGGKFPPPGEGDKPRVKSIES